MNPELERKVEDMKFWVEVVPEVVQQIQAMAGEVNARLMLKPDDIVNFRTALQEAEDRGYERGRKEATSGERMIEEAFRNAISNNPQCWGYCHRAKNGESYACGCTCH